LDADITLSGAIAQFGRTGIIQETANILIRTFVQNLESRLAPPAPAPPADDDIVATTTLSATPPIASGPAPAREINAAKLILSALKAWLRRLFGRGSG
jgi:carbon-monoxide dehydrogenase small subunit